MKSKPVRKYASPKYPTRLEIAMRPNLLQRHQPPAWRQWPELTGAVGLFLLADAARLPAAENLPSGNPNPAQAKAVAIVAPVFQHGEGRGATGCIVMAPPVFLSEEEAMQVIREEMTGKGLQLGTNQTTLAGITIERGVFSATPTSNGATNRTKPARLTYKIQQEPFRADGADPEKKVFVEFLSWRNADTWDRERDKEAGKFGISSVQSYDLPKTAVYLAGRVKRQVTEKVYFGAFYDPLAVKQDFSKALDDKTFTWSKFAAATEDAKIESRRLLRLQVQDFLKWLQAQGAI